VVDNSNEIEGGRMRDLLHDNFGDKVRYIKNQNLGYGQGNNVGITNATGDIICIMNPDVRFTEELLKNVIQRFRNPDVASVGYLQKTPFGGYSYFRMPEFFIPLWSSVINKVYNKFRIFNQYRSFLSGAFVFFRKSDFIQIGLYDENIFMYFEESDVAHRINKLGKKIIFDNTKSYLHLTESQTTNNPKLITIHAESLKYYFNKYKLNFNKYRRYKILELNIHKILFRFLGNDFRLEQTKIHLELLKKV
jgi:GT2 family glycosyltransferase